MPPRKPPKAPTRERLEKSALHYLERYAASAEGLRRVHMRKVERAAREGLADRAQGAEDVAAVVAKLVASRLLDDARFAEGRAASLARRGLPRGRIAQRLKVVGVEVDDIERALGSLDEAGENDLKAATIFAKRKRLGPFADPARRAAARMKHLAALARAGFSGELARRVVDAADPAALADED
jgi:regulatory protein